MKKKGSKLNSIGLQFDLILNTKLLAQLSERPNPFRGCSGEKEDMLSFYWPFWDMCPATRYE